MVAEKPAVRVPFQVLVMWKVVIRCSKPQDRVRGRRIHASNASIYLPMPAARIGQALTLPRLSASRIRAGSAKPHAVHGAWKSPWPATQGTHARLHHGCASHAHKVIGLLEAQLARVLLRRSGSAARVCPARPTCNVICFAPWPPRVSASLAARMRGATLSRVAAPVRFGWQRRAWAGLGRSRELHPLATETDQLLVRAAQPGLRTPDCGCRICRRFCPPRARTRCYRAPGQP